MVKSRLQQLIEGSPSHENEIYLKFSESELDEFYRRLEPQNYRELIGHLILLALESPSQRLH